MPRSVSAVAARTSQAISTIMKDIIKSSAMMMPHQDNTLLSPVHSLFKSTYLNLSPRTAPHRK